MKFIVFDPVHGDLIIEVDIVEEAEKILRDYVAKGRSVLTEAGDDVTTLTPPLPDHVYVLWPVQGGDGEGRGDSGRDGEGGGVRLDNG